ncbi:MAG TPA: hypothetical protein VFV50_00570 [Bdellovibrionales bacterium]|nr:hypothetical protein [Bdellovibrionales bacterium]
MTKLFSLIFALCVFSGQQARAAEEVYDSKAKFIKCGKGAGCSYKIMVNGESYKFVSSKSEDLNQEVYSIFDLLEKENKKESSSFCVTGKVINVTSKKISNEPKLFKITSIGPVEISKDKASTARRSQEAMRSDCGAI